MAKPRTEGIRERKRRETHNTLIEVGLELFLEKGYEGTTLDAIADRAGISRRTFFSYFKSKEDIILAWNATVWENALEDLRKTPLEAEPLEAVKQVMRQHISRYKNSAHMRAIDQLMLSSETLKQRKQRIYFIQEKALYAVLSDIWPQPERQWALRGIAMFSIGAMRLALDRWRAQTEKSLEQVLDMTFFELRHELFL